MTRNMGRERKALHGLELDACLTLAQEFSDFITTGTYAVLSCQLPQSVPPQSMSNKLEPLKKTVCIQLLFPEGSTMEIAHEHLTSSINTSKIQVFAKLIYTPG